MPELVVFLMIFVALGSFFLFIHLLMGKFVRPIRPEEDKLTIYECGEPTIGSAWIQFDLRYYVVALLFIVFDVEVAFFFPWAVVFGKANNLAETIEPADRIVLSQKLLPNNIPPLPSEQEEAEKMAETGIPPAQAKGLAWIGFFDIMVFFGVLLVGFAYLWNRGDINWVRSMEGENPEPLDANQPRGPKQLEKVLVES